MPARAIYDSYIDTPSGAELCPVEGVMICDPEDGLQVEYEYGVVVIHPKGREFDLYFPPELAGETYDCVLCHQENWYTASSRDFNFRDGQ